MAAPQTPASPSHAPQRSGLALAAFGVGVPLALGVLYLVDQGYLNETAQRYLHHRVEQVELVMFFCAVSAFAYKAFTALSERAALRREVLPAWDGRPVPTAEARPLLDNLARLPRRLQKTYLVRRVSAVLDFLSSRGSANELDDHLRTLTDTDALTLESSYALTRFITWAIPILGFLGTVLGITGAISGVTPEKLEQNLSQVTDGLALAFDATALGLALTMVTMFLSFLIERTEQGLLEAVDQFVDRQLAHRFERLGAEGGEFVAVVRQNALAVVQACEQLVQRQAEVWARSLEHIEKRAAETQARQQQMIQAALEAALERTLDAHARRLGALEKQAADQGAGLLDRMARLADAACAAGKDQQAALAPVARGLAAQAEALARWQDGGKQLLGMQEELNRNLAALVAALQGFELRMASSEFRIRLETPEPRPELRGLKPGKAA